jgi:hypothetical protein
MLANNMSIVLNIERYFENLPYSGRAISPNSARAEERQKAQTHMRQYLESQRQLIRSCISRFLQWKMTDMLITAYILDLIDSQPDSHKVYFEPQRYLGH